jgi:hypothetical protein
MCLFRSHILIPQECSLVKKLAGLANEKMLYGNVQLARVYLHAWQVTDNEFFRSIPYSPIASLSPLDDGHGI